MMRWAFVDESGQASLRTDNETVGTHYVHVRTNGVFDAVVGDEHAFLRGFLERSEEHTAERASCAPPGNRDTTTLNPGRTVE